MESIHFREYAATNCSQYTKHALTAPILPNASNVTMKMAVVVCSVLKSFLCFAIGKHIFITNCAPKLNKRQLSFLERLLICS